MRNKGWLMMVLVLFAFTGCDRVTDLSASPEYSRFVGKHYRTLRDLVAVETKGQSGDLDLEEPGTMGMPPLDEMKSFPFKEGDTVIAGVLPKGSVLKVTKVQKVQSIESSFVEPFVEIQGGNIFEGKTITAGKLLDTITKPEPQMKAQYVEEVPTGSQ